MSGPEGNQSLNRIPEKQSRMSSFKIGTLLGLSIHHYENTGQVKFINPLKY